MFTGRHPYFWQQPTEVKISVEAEINRGLIWAGVGLLLQEKVAEYLFCEKVYLQKTQ